ncbi:RanBD1 domain-containing protein [Caenorhabditis elegans]|uniref:RanBD1 domain-containing protein n=1 Tax=Caenorhabditis elegans TaxID=6239 RepID=Q21961_CAEEL|nr:RanBD1 domain-containing protein [Caenorhabditis elegans]CCD72320.1 RanBD1 domain-containing protein [Caenorhabditis elegans]|eukprot:NP_495208.1 associated with RAN (nuclear import/export) function [Caenorhabditis elegans]
MSKGFAFKPSALAAKADKLWSDSKTEYTATHSTINHVHLEKKSLGDIIPKSADAPVANEKEVEEAPQAFVFGSKISDRVVNKEGDSTKPGGSDEKTMTATELFQNAVKKDDDKNGAKNFRKEAEQEAERAKEAEKQHAGTSSVEITTGEENDTNIFQAPCKIWAFDKLKNAYSEKGVCNLRINKRVENGLTHHRIVARTSSGTLRVIINSKIFSDMLLERVDKRIRISAMGPEISGVQIFLLKIGFTKTETIPDSDIFYNIMSDLLKLEKGENSRKRKADCDLNASTVKIKDGKEEEEGDQDQVDEGFVIVNKPTEDEVKEEKPAVTAAEESASSSTPSE